MKRWMQHTWVKIIAVALSLSLIAAAVALVLTGTTEPLRGVGETVSRPFSRFFSLVTDKIRQGGDYLKGVQALQEENRALEQEVAQLRRAARAGDLATEENARLRSLLELQETGQDLTFTAAWVVARAPDNWKGEVTLDQGTDQGIQAGQCVVDEHGALVGRVKEVGASSPRDSRSKDPSREPSTPDLVPWPAIWKPGSHSRVTLAQLAPTSFTRPTRAPCSSTTHWPA